METANNISFYAVSDLGQKRTNNEDAYIAQYIWDNENVLAVAIDGVGGYEGGEVAAAIAKQTIVEYLENFPNGERANLLKQAVVEANNNIFKSRAESEYKNMSCVLTATLVESKKGLIHMAHIGDTRLYQYLHCEIKKLSHDHSLVGYREEVGELTEEEAMHHPQRNIIGRDMGSKFMEMNTDQVEMATFQLRANSILLLCSDGLSDMITSSMMSDILSTSMTLEEKAKGLVDKANSEGGKDNITVVLVEYTGEDFIAQEPSIDEELVYAKEDKLKSSTNTQSHIANNYQRELSYIRSLLMVIVALLIIVLLGLGYVLYEVKGNAYKKESMSTQQTEEMISDTDSLQQQAEVPDNE